MSEAWRGPLEVEENWNFCSASLHLASCLDLETYYSVLLIIFPESECHPLHRSEVTCCQLHLITFVQLVLLHVCLLSLKVFGWFLFYLLNIGLLQYFRPPVVSRVFSGLSDLTT